MRQRKYLQHVLIGATAVLFAAAHLVTGADTSGPVVAEAASIVNVEKSTSYLKEATTEKNDFATATSAALAAFEGKIRPLSHSRALEDAFQSYFAYKAAYPNAVKKPYLYFVDYGLPSTTTRGYVFDMDALTIVEGPFTVAHGRGSSTSPSGVPTKFSNVHGSAATSLGLYLAQETYRFSGKSGGKRYTSIGLRMKGLSTGFNDNARTRGVVAHGAPYVSKSRAGRSEGCPAVEEWLARKIMPKLSNGGMVFLFAPNEKWMAGDPWIANAQKLASAGQTDAPRVEN